MKRIAIGIIVLFVVAVAALLIYLNFIRDDAPEEFGLTETTTEDAEGSDGTEAPVEDNADAGATDADETVSLDGTWNVDDGSQAGYRVVEDLRGLQDFEAVGRTSDVTGTLVLSGTTISEASFEVRIDTITSDDERRDGQFTGEIMDAAGFPTASLVLTEPIELDAVPAAGSSISTTATGELTLRGTTKPVTFPVDAQLLDDRIEIVASVDVLFSDYGIANPTNPFVTVRDEGKVEVQLFLAMG